jgi:hypothetical protein
MISPIASMLSPLVLAQLATICIGCLAGYYFQSSPIDYLDTIARDTILSPLGLICNAHTSISNLQPTTPATLFSILHLDHTKPPFYPAEECAAPHHANYKAARQAVVDAWAEATEKRDGNMREWRDALSAAAVILLNDTTRVIYMKEVLPKVLKDGDKAWRDKCTQP